MYSMYSKYLKKIKAVDYELNLFYFKEEINFIRLVCILEFVIAIAIPI